MALQSFSLVSGVAAYGDATAMNVVYRARGVWSVAAVWLTGHWFAKMRESGSARNLLRKGQKRPAQQLHRLALPLPDEIPRLHPRGLRGGGSEGLWQPLSASKRVNGLLLGKR